MSDTNKEIMSEKYSLLVLNDDCIMEIFQRMTLIDYVHLIDTCQRLRELGSLFSARNFKTIRINATNKQQNNTISSRDVSQILSKIGQYVHEIELFGIDDVITGLVASKCTNLKILTVTQYFGPGVLRHFKELHTLEILGGGNIQLYQWKDFVALNPELKVLDYDSTDGRYEEGFIKLMAGLPKLESLGIQMIQDSFYGTTDFQDLRLLNNLRKLSLRSLDNLNEMLTDLPKNFLELELRMRFDAHSLTLLSAFLNLQVLCISSSGEWDDDWFENVKVFPKSLKKFTISWINIYCNKFLELLEHLISLEEFHMESAQILCDGKVSNFKESQVMVIQRIDNALKLKQRTLKIVQPHYENNKFYLYQSENLQVINRYYVKKGANDLMVNPRF